MSTILLRTNSKFYNLLFVNFKNEDEIRHLLVKEIIYNSEKNRNNFLMKFNQSQYSTNNNL